MPDVDAILSDGRISLQGSGFYGRLFVAAGLLEAIPTFGVLKRPPARGCSKSVD
jgi:hypothetical protein